MSIGPIDTGGIFGTSDSTSDAVDAEPVTRAQFSDYVNQDADTLFGRFEFGRLAGDIGRGVLFGLLAMLTAAVLAVREAYRQTVAPLLGIIREFITELFLIPAGIQAATVEQAAGELDVFGLFALPVSIVVALSTAGALLLVAYLFWGWGG